MVEKLKDAILLINKEMVQEWTKDLVLSKTFVQKLGSLCCQFSYVASFGPQVAWKAYWKNTNCFQPEGEFTSVTVLKTEGFDAGKPQKGIAKPFQGELCR